MTVRNLRTFYLLEQVLCVMTDEKSKSDSRGKSIFDLAEGTRPKSGVFEGEALSVATYQVILRPTSSGFGFAFSHDGTSQVTDVSSVQTSDFSTFSIFAGLFNDHISCRISAFLFSA